MAFRFRAEQTFEATVNDRQNRYVAGKTYTCRDGATYADLRKKVKTWEAEGLVTVLGNVPNDQPIRASTG
jgi:hypothetical protein